MTIIRQISLLISYLPFHENFSTIITTCRKVSQSNLNIVLPL